MWQSFLPFGLSVAICIFVSWKAAENQLELRESGSGRGGEGDDDARNRYRARGRERGQRRELRGKGSWVTPRMGKA